MTYEVRSIPEPVELRSEGDRLVASGIAIRYGVRSKPIRGKFVEEIRSGAATKTLQEQDIMALHEHKREMMLGRTSSGTLRLTDSPTELRYEVDLPRMGAGPYVAELIERRDVKGSSFGFAAIPASVKWSVTETGMALRSVGEIYLDHIATTCAPAYGDAPVEMALRSIADQFGRTLDEVMAAADRGDLASVISPPEGDEDQRSDDDGREAPTVHRRPAHWFA